MPETQIIAAREEHRYYPYSGIFYLSRKSFWAAGQDSFTQPPAQNPDMFERLTNVEPVLQGILERRRGYGLFSALTPPAPFTLGYSFRNDLLGLRRVVFTGSSSGVVATDESGLVTNSPLFVPSSGALAPRMVLSRNFGYFADGRTTDNLKWDGTTASNNITNWGIDVSASSSFGPNTATVAADQGASGTSGSQGPLNCGLGSDIPLGGGVGWVSAGNIAVSGAAARVSLDGVTNTTSDYLAATNFGFSVPTGATIKGISFSFSRIGPGSTFATQDLSVRVLKAGVPSGTDEAGSGFWSTAVTNVSYGGSSDLWGLTWTASDINSSNFGLAVAIENVSGLANTRTAQVFAFVTAKVFYNVTSANSWTNPGNITTCATAVATATASTSVSSDLRGTGFGFAASGTITGISVTFKADTNDGPFSLSPVLVKAGSITGTRKQATISNMALGTVTFGGQFDLWGASWLASDVNNSNFGVQFNVSKSSGSALAGVNCAQITVFTQTGPIIVGAPSAGAITLLSGRTYFYAFQNSLTGHTSTLSLASLSTGPLTNQQVPLSGIPTSPDPQVDTVLILATADGNDQTTLFLLASLPNGTATYADNTPDTVLLTQSLYQDTDSFGQLHGIANNNRPPGLLFPVKHKGRIYGALGSTLYFSKNLDEVTTANGLTTSKWEEAWPAVNSLDISETAETIKGLLSDGETLWIGTERAIRRLIGDSPQNFQKPEIQFNETGLFNQDVWKIVFYEGQPVGSMWLTPDLRVMSSDFNTYQDVGWPIQDVLNSVNIGATFGPQASFVSRGPSDYFMLYLPTGSNTAPDTVCVYNLRTKQWFIWQPTDQAPGSLFFIDATGSPRWLFSSQAGAIYEWLSGTLLDRVGNGPVGFPVTLRTSWLDFGDSNLRKVLNQLLYLGGDTTLSVQVEGAILDSELDGGAFLVLPLTPVASGPLEDLYMPLAGTNSKHRWYRFTFVSPTNAVSDVLDGFSVEALGLFRY